MYKLFLILSLLFSTVSSDEYELGEGLQLGSFPIYIGGYFSVDYQNADKANQLRIDDFALMAY